MNLFLNSNYALLSHLHSIMNPDGVSHITQQELADKIMVSRITVNKMIQDLKREEYVIVDPRHIGRYRLTEKAIVLVESFQEINSKL